MSHARTAMRMLALLALRFGGPSVLRDGTDYSNGGTPAAFGHGETDSPSIPGVVSAPGPQ